MMRRTIAGLGTVLLGMAGFAAAQADTVINVTQYSYNYNNQVVCTAVRMNPATFGALSSDACAPMTTVGSNGPDRITANIYDAAGQLTAVEQAYGTSNVRVYASYTYTDNGLKQTETDANNNTTTFTYDGFDRLVTLQYPNTTLSSGTSSTSDYETFTYDPNDNRKTWRRRNNQTITYTYDNLNREVIADVPALTGVYNATEKDIYTTYDAFGRVTKKAFASYTGVNNVSYTYNGLGWVATTTDMAGRTISYLYNAAGARLRLTDQEGYYVAYSLDNLNRIQKATLNGTTNVLYSYTYNAIGQMTQLTKGVAGTGGGTTTYAYDDLGRVQGMAVDQATTGYDITWGKVGATGAVAYNAANQITTWASSSNIFDYVETTTAPENRTFDGLNRDANLATVAGGYDANGNLAKDNPRAFVYDIYNRLLSATGGANNISLVYDPEGRLVQTTTATGSKEYLYDGTNLITEYSNGGTTPTSRYIHGSGTDNPIVWLKGADDSDRRYYYSNYQGSIVGYVGATGAFVTGGLTRYNAYGQPQNSANAEVWPGTRFGYTGQVVLPDAYLYYYKARVYDPKHGRFLQTDPIGSKDDLDLYAYVGGDPINRSDPTGLSQVCTGAGKSQSCVWADGNGDGNSHDNDMSTRQISQAAHDYKGFIKNNNGMDVGGFGKDVTVKAGDDAPSDVVTSVRVTSQFVGAGISVYGNAQDKKDWAGISGIQIQNDIIFGPASMALGTAGGKSLIGVSWNPSIYLPYQSYSDMARIMFHETHHMSHPETPLGDFFGEHNAVDAWARRALKATGLDGNGCMALNNFPGC